MANGKYNLTLSGLRITEALLAEVFAAMPKARDTPSGKPRPLVSQNVTFDEAEFVDYVDAQHLTFARRCSMIKAKFQKGVIFNGSRFGSLDLRGATIVGKAKLSNIAVDDSAVLTGIKTTELLNIVRGKIQGDLDLRYAKCAGVWLSFTRIAGMAKFSFARLDGGPDAVPSQHCLGRFDGAEFGGPADFVEATLPWETTFGGYDDMNPARFEGPVSFRNATFGSPELGGRHLLQRLNFVAVDLSSSTFYGRVSFSGSRFNSHPILQGLRVLPSERVTDQAPDGNDYLFPSTNLDMTQLRLPEGAHLTDIAVNGSMAINCLELDGDFEVTGTRVTEELVVSGTTFQYLPFQAEAGVLRFTRCQFARGGVISGATGSLELIECDSRQPMSLVSQDPDRPIALTSLDRTNVDNLALVGVDLSKAVFAGAINLDKMRLQGPSRFLRAPRLFGQGREIIMDEVLVRRTRRQWRTLANVRQPGSSHYEGPQSVAALYRSLRKNREDSKDEPGGADFYYGEMEMRRASAKRWTAERFLLTAYWAVSGYGLRAWRALTCLLAVVAVAGVLLSTFGYRASAPMGVRESTILFAETSVGLARLPDHLTAWGSTVFIVGRLICPALIALAVLAVRGRVKR